MKKLPDWPVPKHDAVLYFAGFFDGEGSIEIRRYLRSDGHRMRHTLHVSVSNTCESVLRWIATAFGGSVCKVRDRGPRNSNCWVWSTGSARSAWVLKTLRPYLRVKAAEADIALEMYADLADTAWMKKYRTTPDTILKRRDKLLRKFIALRRKVRNYTDSKYEPHRKQLV